MEIKKQKSYVKWDGEAGRQNFYLYVTQHILPTPQEETYLASPTGSDDILLSQQEEQRFLLAQ